MTTSDLGRRIEKLEAVRDPFDVTTMSDDDLRRQMDETLQALGGQEAALVLMRSIPGFDPETIQTIEEWPAWHP